MRQAAGRPEKPENLWMGRRGVLRRLREALGQGVRVSGCLFFWFLFVGLLRSFFSIPHPLLVFFLFVCFPWFLSCSPCLQLFSSLLFFLSFFFSPSSQSSSFFGISILLVFPLFLPFYKPSLLFPSLLLSPFLPFLPPPLSLRILATRENDWWYDSNCKR